MKAHTLILIILLTLMLASCGPAPEATPPVEIPPTDPPAVPTDEPAAPQPTATPVIEYVALVNGEGIRKSSYNASLLQLEAALDQFPGLVGPDQTPGEIVIQELINRVLLAQAARAGGFTADLQMTVDRMAALIEQAGGNEVFEMWLEESGYTLETYSYEVPLEMEAAWQRDQIAATVPEEVEQVRAQQILFYDPFQAERAMKQLNAGFAFETIAQNNDPTSLGYLDWFPRDVLLFPKLEEVVFSLQPGQYSDVIETDAGYHILYVFEKGLHSLSSESRLILEEQAVVDWLAEQRAGASIQVDLP